MSDECTYRAHDGRDLVRMAVPVAPSGGAVFLLEGEGLPMRAVVGAPGIDAERLLEMSNRFLKGALYDRVRRVQCGLVALGPRSRNENFMTRGGATVGEGRSRGTRTGGGFREVVDFPPAAAWVVTHAGGRCLALMPRELDSVAVCDSLAPAFSGSFCVEAVIGGEFAAAECPVVAGWCLPVAELLGREPAPGSSFH